MDARLTAIIVHDIKNALAVLEGELRTMADAPDRARARQAHATCLALQEKLVGFLMLYKSSSQGLGAQIDGYSPQDFLEGVIRQTNVHRPGVQVSINTQDKQDMPVLGFFDENLVALALEAALQNAMRFAHARVEIGCRAEDGGLVFSVRDDGPGIGTKEDTPSTGVGMPLCRAIAEAHTRGEKKGSVLLADHPGGGAVFEMRLP